MMLSLDTAYRSFGGEVEASSTPTICRLPDSRRHQLSAIAMSGHEAMTIWKGIAIGVGLVVESALCASAQTPDQSEETKRTLTQQFLDCVTSQVITIDDLTSDVASTARGAVSLFRAQAHAAAVSKAGRPNELGPKLPA